MNKQQLASKIWESANKMRSKIEANEYKDYILGFIFYKFLSETEVTRLKARDFAEEDLPSLVEDDEETVEFVKGECGYFIAYDNLFSTWVAKGGDFEISNVRDALSAFSRNIDPARKRVFDGIFDTLQTGLSKLGTDARSQSKAARDLIYLIKDIPMDGRQDYDVLGFIYEYLISNFAANAGKKAGEFYTPHEVSMLMSEIVSWHLAGRENITIYDPTSGSVAAHQHRQGCGAPQWRPGLHQVLRSGAQGKHLQSHAHEPGDARHPSRQHRGQKRRHARGRLAVVRHGGEQGRDLRPAVR